MGRAMRLARPIYSRGGRMKVVELIAVLQTLPQEDEIFIGWEDDDQLFRDIPAIYQEDWPHQWGITGECLAIGWTWIEPVKIEKIHPEQELKDVDNA